MPAGRKFFDVPPHFSLVPPHEGAQRLFVADCETIIEVSPSVGSAVCTSTGEVGRGAIKVMGPSVVPCRLLGY